MHVGTWARWLSGLCCHQLLCLTLSAVPRSRLSARALAVGMVLSSGGLECCVCLRGRERTALALQGKRGLLCY